MIQATDIPSIGNLIIAAGVGAVALMTRSVLANQKSHGEKLEGIKASVTKIEHWAWGPLGDNGINSKVNRHDSEIDALQRKS